MIRVETGHYRDTFRRVCYDVKRCSLPWGGRPTVWMYILYIPGGEKVENGSWPTKDEAARYARVAISRMKDEEV